MTSGSGAGQRLLEQRTIARQIKKIEIVGMCRKTAYILNFYIAHISIVCWHKIYHWLRSEYLCDNTQV